MGDSRGPSVLVERPPDALAKFANRGRRLVEVAELVAELSVKVRDAVDRDTHLPGDFAAGLALAKRVDQELGLSARQDVSLQLVDQVGGLLVCERVLAASVEKSLVCRVGGRRPSQPTRSSDHGGVEQYTVSMSARSLHKHVARLSATARRRNIHNIYYHIPSFERYFNRQTIPNN